jgi:dolichol-phosphate mannosyltransferase
MSVVLVLGSAQLLVLGVIGEYLGRLYQESKRRPLFIVEEIVGPLDQAPPDPSAVRLSQGNPA